MRAIILQCVQNNNNTLQLPGRPTCHEGKVFFGAFPRKQALS